MRESFKYIFLFTTIFSLFVPAPFAKVQAQAWSANDLINAVNEVRASYGLVPYVIDGELMAIAQSHSDYQASIETITHTRADGTGPGDLGITAENIGGGTNASPDILINRQWMDDLHRNTLIGYTEGLVGAGVAEVNGFYYYTLDVKRTGEKTNLLLTSSTAEVSGGTILATTAGSSSSKKASPTPIITVTPQADGSLIHTIYTGETLWSIAQAYGYQVDALIIMNGLPTKDPVIYVGQKIFIRRAFTPTMLPTNTDTPLPPTRTSYPSRTPRPPKPTALPTMSQTATIPALIPDMSVFQPGTRRTIGFLIVGICLLGIVGVLITDLQKRRRS